MAEKVIYVEVRVTINNDNVDEITDAMNDIKFEIIAFN